MVHQHAAAPQLKIAILGNGQKDQENTVLVLEERGVPKNDL